MASNSKRESKSRIYGRLAVAMSAVALFSAAGGPAWADGLIGGREIMDDSITNHDIADDNLDATSLAPGSIGTSEIGYGVVSAEHVAWGSLGGNRIADGSLTGTDLQDESVSNADLGTNSVLSPEIMNYSVSEVDLANAAVQRRTMDIRTFTTTFTLGLSPNRCVMGATQIPVGSNAVFQPQFDHAGGYIWAYAGLSATAYSTVSNGTAYMMTQLCNFTGGQWTPPSGGLRIRVSYVY